MSSYHPVWVKKDAARFPSALTKDGKTLPILSTLGAATAEADGKAYAAMMRHRDRRGGGIRNIYLHDCIFDGTDQAFRFKSRRPRGGGAENIYIERVKANVLKDALFVDYLGSSRWVGRLAERYPAPEVTRLTPYLRSISIHDIEIEHCRNLINITALPELKASSIFFRTNRIFCGARCYSSDDFYNWKDEGGILTPSSDPASPLHWSQKLESPHIVYSEKTGKYVCYNGPKYWTRS